MLTFMYYKSVLQRLSTVTHGSRGTFEKSTVGTPSDKKPLSLKIARAILSLSDYQVCAATYSLKVLSVSSRGLPSD